MAAAQQGVQPPAASAEIRPTATEELFFTYLNDFVKKGRLRVKPRIPETECRIAGGWVRDKVRKRGFGKRKKRKRMKSDEVDWHCFATALGASIS